MAKFAVTLLLLTLAGSSGAVWALINSALALVVDATWTTSGRCDFFVRKAEGVRSDWSTSATSSGSSNVVAGVVPAVHAD